MSHAHRRAQVSGTGAALRALLLGLPLVLVSLLPGWVTPAADAQLNPGDGLVIDSDDGTDGRGALFRVDPTTGARTLLSDFGNAGQGALGLDPVGVAVEAAGSILVTDASAPTSRGALFRVDPTTGARTLLSDFGNAGQGPLGEDPVGVAVEFGGAILVVDQQGPDPRGALFRVNPATGARTLLSDFGNAGQGPLGFDPSGVAVETAGTGPILVTDFATGTGGRGALFRVDPTTGARTLLSDFGNAGQGALGLDPFGVGVEAAGSILVSDINAPTSRGALFRVDPATGARTLLSNFGDAGQGPLGLDPVGVAVEAAGSILVSDREAGTGGQGGLSRVDPATGARTLLSDFGDAGQGPLGLDPFGVAVVPPPLHAFSAFSARIRVTLDPAGGSNAFLVTAPFTLGAGSDGIDPLTEPVGLQVGTFFATLPPGSFTLGPNGAARFEGVINNVNLQVAIFDSGGGQFWAVLRGDVNPETLTLTLTIGNDAGRLP